MAHDLMPIRSQSEKHRKLHTLINRVDVAHLLMAHDKQSVRKAVGVDGITKMEYEANLVENLRDLVSRMKAFKYVPKPVKRVYIPKANGKLRPLGLPSYEDKLVQSVMADILSDVYEPRFVDSSYGFRPGRSAHDVVRRLDHSLMRDGINWVLDADIEGFFDNVDQEWLMKFLEHDIGDPNFLRYVKRFLRAGIMEGTELKDSDKGTPQGGLISPVLANVYLHYVLDLWVEVCVKGALKGRVQYVRYADDFVLLFEYEHEARIVMEKLKGRLNKFGLKLAADKTRIIPFSARRGVYEEFDFLGFMFYATKSRKGFWRCAVRSSAKKLKAKRKAVKDWLRTRFTLPVWSTLMVLSRKLQGHCNYYGISGNARSVRRFYRYVAQRTYWMLGRRSQRKKITRRKFNELWNMYVKPPRIVVNVWSGK